MVDKEVMSDNNYKNLLPLKNILLPAGRQQRQQPATKNKSYVAGTNLVKSTSKGLLATMATEYI